MSSRARGVSLPYTTRVRARSVPLLALAIPLLALALAAMSSPRLPTILALVTAGLVIADMWLVRPRRASATVDAARRTVTVDLERRP